MHNRLTVWTFVCCLLFGDTRSKCQRMKASDKMTNLAFRPVDLEDNKILYRQTDMRERTHTQLGISGVIPLLRI